MDRRTVKAAYGSRGLSRREALLAGAGGIVSAATMLSGSGLARLSAQNVVTATPPPAPDPRFPMPPSWNRELRRLAPNVYAYVQGGGPNLSAAGVSNTGLLVGPEYLLAIDAAQGPLPAKGFIDAARQATGREIGRLVNTHHHGDHVNGNQSSRAPRSAAILTAGARC